MNPTWSGSAPDRTVEHPSDRHDRGGAGDSTRRARWASPRVPHGSFHRAGGRRHTRAFAKPSSAGCTSSVPSPSQRRPASPRLEPVRWPIGPRDLCVIDLALPDGSGLALLSELRQAGWTPLRGPLTRRRPLLGARGRRGRRQGLRRDRRQRRRSPHLSAGLAARGLAQTVCRRVRSRCSRWSPQGRSNRDIGGELNLSALTVKSHLARIARKLGTGDRAEMVAVALRAGVIS